MNEQNLFQITPRRLALFASLVAGMLLLILVGITYQRSSALARLESQIETIQENFSERKNLDLEKIAELEQELAAAQDEVEELQDFFPEPGTSVSLYLHAAQLARESQVELQEISLSSAETVDAPEGSLQSAVYLIRLSGGTKPCISFIERLEELGLQKVTMDEIVISPLENLCQLEARLLGFQP